MGYEKPQIIEVWCLRYHVSNETMTLVRLDFWKNERNIES